jgi:hypothetical protein
MTTICMPVRISTIFAKRPSGSQLMHRANFVWVLVVSVRGVRVRVVRLPV